MIRSASRGFKPQMAYVCAGGGPTAPSLCERLQPIKRRGGCAADHARHGAADKGGLQLARRRLAHVPDGCSCQEVAPDLRRFVVCLRRSYARAQVLRSPYSGYCTLLTCHGLTVFHRGARVPRRRVGHALQLWRLAATGASLWACGKTQTPPQNRACVTWRVTQFNQAPPSPYSVHNMHSPTLSRVCEEAWKTGWCWLA